MDNGLTDNSLSRIGFIWITTKNMNLYNKFKEETGVDLLDACKHKGINYGFIIDTEEDIESSIEFDEEGFMQFYTKMIQDYKSNKHSEISTNKIVKAIIISLNNCKIDTKRVQTKETWLSEHVFTNDQCINTCLKYGEFCMNPLVFIFDKENYSKYQSILYGKKLKLVGLSVKNGNNYRHSRFFLQRNQLDRFDIDKVDKVRYHPIIWKLLEEGRLEEYKDLYLKTLEKGEKKKI